MKNTYISWCDHTHNFWCGCTKRGPECLNCYAEAQMDKRFGRARWGPAAARVPATMRYNSQLSGLDAQVWFECRECGYRGREDREGSLACPKCWSVDTHLTRQRVFVGSLMDFAERKDDLVEPRRNAVQIMTRYNRLVYMILTKRPEEFLPLLDEALGSPNAGADWLRANPHIHVGVSVGVRASLPRITVLANEIPAAVKFVSFEPLLESLDISTVPGIKEIDLGIVGGESGQQADIRPMHPAWADRLMAHLNANGILTHFKQWGEWVPIREIANHIGDGQYVLRPEFKQAAKGKPWAEVDADGKAWLYESGFDPDDFPYKQSGNTALMVRIGKRNDPKTWHGHVIQRNVEVAP